jgi:hypothetical protein
MLYISYNNLVLVKIELKSQKEVTAMSRILLVSAALILVGTVLAIIIGLMDLATKATVDGQLSGFYLFGCGLFFTPIALFPFRRGEKWAWYTALISGGIALIGQMVLAYFAGSALPSFALPASIMLVALWIVGITLSSIDIFSLTA